jgi:nucleoside-diphosphate-sugar epimerase
VNPFTDPTRAVREFGFKAKSDFRDGLRKTIAWYIQACRKASSEAVHV